MATRRPSRTYTPSEAVRAAMPEISGNAINGLGERTPRQASPMFWHPAEQHPFGALQVIAGASCRVSQEALDAFAAAYDHPPLEPLNPHRPDRTAGEWTALAREFALAHEADLFGATRMEAHYIVDGYAIAEPNVIMLGVSHDWDRLRQVPALPRTATALQKWGNSMRGERVPPLRWRTGSADRVIPQARFRVRAPLRSCSYRRRSRPGWASLASMARSSTEAMDRTCVLPVSRRTCRSNTSPATNSERTTCVPIAGYARTHVRPTPSMKTSNGCAA